MQVRLGNPAPVFVKSHGPLCHPDCPTRHAVVTGMDEATGDAVVEQLHHGATERVTVPLDEQETHRVTTFDIAVTDNPDEQTRMLDKAFTSIVDANGAWAAHSATAPLWVWSDWPALQRKLAAWYDCPSGDPSQESNA
jgi:hypothetical protein